MQTKVIRYMKIHMLHDLVARCLSSEFKGSCHGVHKQFCHTKMRSLILETTYLQSTISTSLHLSLKQVVSHSATKPSRKVNQSSIPTRIHAVFSFIHRRHKNSDKSSRWRCIILLEGVWSIGAHSSIHHYSGCKTAFCTMYLKSKS